MAQESPDKEQHSKSEAAQREEQVLSFWDKEKIFEQSLSKTSPKGDFVFYDGPPFATGLPHHGHFLGSVAKDLFGRYKTMRGFNVRRRWGWDCHGLPIENMVEKELGLKSKKEIEKIGVKEFNETCRSTVLRYADEWEKYVKRIGRWVEYKNSYKTMDPTYMESVWWALKEIHKKGLLYEGRKVLLYCPHCETPLAKAEVAMDNSYKDITEESVVLKFEVKDPEANSLPKKTYLLAWTTTPWTLPGNVALAVGSEIKYSLVTKGGANYILATALVETHFPEGADKIVSIETEQLIGVEYKPLFNIEAVRRTGKKAWYVTTGDFVTTEEGTGIVHTAVIYGEDDYKLGVRENLPMVPLLDASGRFNDRAPEIIQGSYFKDAEAEITNELKNKELLFSSASHTHSYPHCHRCDTPLLYNALTSWFINIQKVKNRLLKLNRKTNWVPEHLKEGRFLNILKSAPDWTISRNRYWASPLPIWKCSDCSEVRVIGSVEELKKSTRVSGNKYIGIRHGQADNNARGVAMNDPDSPAHLTELGKEQIKSAARKLKSKKIDLIIVSPFVRTRETADILMDELNIPKDKVIVDERIREIKVGEFNGRPVKDYYNFFNTREEKITKRPEGGENLQDVKVRTGEFLYELEKNYRDKTILIVGHDDQNWAMFSAAEGLNTEQTLKTEDSMGTFLGNGEVRVLNFIPLPHNEIYELDLHRPYIDEIILGCSCGADMRRISEVVDGWVESASMPFAEYHYPFENKREFRKRNPGDFVAEYIAQTRTWFYYMHVIAGVLFKNISFRNVVTTGNILAEDGSKMSKSKKNYTDPLLNLDRFGADALRYYLMTSVVMRAEDVRFTDEELREVHNRLINILWNVYRFYDTYADDNDGSTKPLESKHVLDKWIISRLNELKQQMTDGFEKYDTVTAGRPVRDFVTDFSTWYLRRSRERFKSEDNKDKQNALATTRYVLVELSRLLAPVTPFIAESIYKGVGGRKKSVHLESWPSRGKADTKILESMKEVRDTVSLALEERASAGIKIRQPLKSLTVRHPESGLRDDDELLLLIRDEVNVKEVIFEDSTGWEVELDKEITPELKEEGEVRDLIRSIQIMRKNTGLTPNDRPKLNISTDELGKNVIEKYKKHIKTSALLDEISTSDGVEGKEIKTETGIYVLSLKN